MVTRTRLSVTLYVRCLSCHILNTLKKDTICAVFRCSLVHLIYIINYIVFLTV